MDRCDVVIAGGGPAGSTCASSLRRAGLDVVVVDKAAFPRDKVCAGWITPQVVEDLGLDVDAYREGRTFQPFTGFRVGTIGGREDVDTLYDHPVSFGIRRSEFDDYLLWRSEARLRLGTAITSLHRDGPLWVINENLAAPMLVGAGGHFCPVAKALNGSSRGGSGLVVAQEAEFAIEPSAQSSFTTVAERPEIYFSRALDGYGWCIRKQHYLNLGFGHTDQRSLPGATAAFVSFLESRHTIPRGLSCRWRGHAYRLAGPPRCRVLADGVVLAGDAAGLACARSGEGIRAAVESGLVAASTILAAHGRYTSEQLAPYDEQLRRRFGAAGVPDAVSRALPRLARMLAPWLLRMPWFVRHVVLNRWFLHVHDDGLAPHFKLAAPVSAA